MRLVLAPPSPCCKRMKLFQSVIPADNKVMTELAKMSKLIMETDATQDQTLDDIKNSTFAVESKLAEISSDQC